MKLQDLEELQRVAALVSMMRGESAQTDHAKSRRMARALTLRIGLSVTATVDISDQHGQLLSDAPPPHVAAIAASAESTNADARVAAIIQANLR